jgi:hypothetical protein
MSNDSSVIEPTASKTNVAAILALVFSVVGFLTLFFWIGLPLAIAGAIMGHVGLGQIAKRNEAGRGLALAGVIIGWIAVGVGVLGVIVILAFFGSLAGVGALDF